jgi:Zn-dependent peptidase ImmA (M78 family)
MATSQGALAVHLNEWLEKKFNLPQSDLPDLGRETKPENAGDSLRRYWKIGELSIRNMVHLLEAHGVRVFSLTVDARDIDAFSMWRDTTPFVFLNMNKTAEHSRFDAAHELGHLVLHKHGAPNGRTAENEANAFASAFLMPRASVIAKAPRFPTFQDLVKAKKNWKTSVAALNYRMHSVGMLSDWQYRTLCIDIATRGRENEPEEIPRELSQVLPAVFAALYQDGVSRSDVARELAIPQSELEQLMFGLTMTGIDGGRQQATGTPMSRKLKLVK